MLSTSTVVFGILLLLFDVVVLVLVVFKLLLLIINPSTIIISSKGNYIKITLRTSCPVVVRMNLGRREVVKKNCRGSSIPPKGGSNDYNLRVKTFLFNTSRYLMTMSSIG